MVYKRRQPTSSQTRDRRALGPRAVVVVSDSGGGYGPQKPSPLRIVVASLPSPHTQKKCKREIAAIAGGCLCLLQLH